MEDLSLSSLNDLLQRIGRRKAEVNALRPFTPEQEGRIMQKFRLDLSKIFVKEALAQIKAHTGK